MQKELWTNRREGRNKLKRKEGNEGQKEGTKGGRNQKKVGQKREWTKGRKGRK